MSSGALERIADALETNTRELRNLTLALKSLERAVSMRDDRNPKRSYSEQLAEAVSRIFDELYEVDPCGEVSRSDIQTHFDDCENSEIAALISEYNLRDPRSAGYRALVAEMRVHSTRERMVRGVRYFSGIRMKKVSYVDSHETNDDPEFF